LFDWIARQLFTHFTTSAETTGATAFQVLPHLMQLIVVGCTPYLRACDKAVAPD
jgi:hypothetical protein